MPESAPPAVPGAAEDAVLWRALGRLSPARYVRIGSAPESGQLIRRLPVHWSGLSISAEAWAGNGPEFLRGAAGWAGPAGLIAVDSSVQVAEVPGAADATAVVILSAPGRAGGPNPSLVSALLETGYIRGAEHVDCFIRSDRLIEWSAALAASAAPGAGESLPDEPTEGGPAARESEAEGVEAALSARLRQAEAEVRRWQAAAIDSWAEEMTSGDLRTPADIRAELDAIRGTLSWRVTAPLRAVRARQAGIRARRQ